MEEVKRLNAEWTVNNGPTEEHGEIQKANIIQESPLESMEATEVDRLFPFAGKLTLLIWAVLLFAVYTLCPAESFEVLDGVERKVPATACVVLIVVLLMNCLPFFNVVWKKKRRPSGIMFAALVSMGMAVVTNGLLVMFPTVVLVDPVTGARVFLVRWCEWIPLAGLLTFLSEAVDVPKKNGIQVAVRNSLLQFVSAACGIVFPFCTNRLVWGAVMVVSMSTYLPIFTLVEMKRQKLLNTAKGVTFEERETYDRRYFAYSLLRLCSIIWTVLVFFYFLNWLLHYVSRENSRFRQAEWAMALDSIFDVLAKGFYTSTILEVHDLVFDVETRMHRQLNELRNLMSVVWDSSTDAIFVSVQNEGKGSTLFSPSFALIADTVPSLNTIKSDGAHGVMLETDMKPGCSTMTATKANIIESEYFSSMEGDLIVAPIALHSRLVEEATKFVNAVWQRKANSIQDKGSVLLLHELTRLDGETCYCEIKVCRRTPYSIVALVRDVSEQYKRFSAEERAHQESLARQKDAQTINRFTRHEVKNGLLGGMELCERLVESFDKMSIKVNESLGVVAMRDPLLEAEMSKTGGLIGQVDRVLHEVLDTILAEAMARDVVHQCYTPSARRVVLESVLKSSSLGVGTEKRFPLELPTQPVPPFMLDATMLRYVHRNAMSNASKYGRPAGKIITRVFYDEHNEWLRIEVENEPGYGHRELLLMSEEEANTLVFQQGSRLHFNIDQEVSNMSSGDGAWIMQKCAENMGGKCSIRFFPKKTVFSFECPASPYRFSKADEPFEIPDNTWGIGIDDSAVQRRVLLRILNEIGIKKSRRKVTGETLQQIRELKELVVSILDTDPVSRVLLLVDENLDFELKGGGRHLMSGSERIEQIMYGLSEAKRNRLLVLIRSANDSADDVAIYLHRAHGFLPKSANKRDAALEYIAPCWLARFGREKGFEKDKISSDVPDDDELLTKEDLRAIVSSVDELLQGRSYHDVPWEYLWSALHSLKGDIMVSDNPFLLWASKAIVELRGSETPPDFEERWTAIREAIGAAINGSKSDSPLSPPTAVSPLCTPDL